MSTTGRTATTSADTTTPTTADEVGGSTFLTWLEGMRDELNLSWAEVGRRSGISETGLRKIRQGEATPRPATIDALNRAFGLSPDGPPRADILTGDPASGSFWALQVKRHDETPDAPLVPFPARRGPGAVVTYVTVGVPGSYRLPPETAGRLIRFLEGAGQAWLATAEHTPQHPHGKD